MKILLPVDGSPVALQAVRHALGLVREGLKAEFVLANVQEPAMLYEVMMARDVEVLEQVADGAGAYLLEGAARLLDEAGVPYVREVASGDPAHTLIEIIERHGCDAVIIGSSSVGTMRSVLVGSVSHSLLHDSPVPVTVVHQRDDDTEELPEETVSADDDAPAGGA